MDNRIRQIVVRNIQLSPAQAEVWITVVPEHQTPTTELRGRLMGPRCPYANTVEVAYPLRPLAPTLGALTQPRSPEPVGLTRRVLIPEVNLWEPQCPFLYEGPIELWQDGVRCEQAIIRHGLRSLRCKERGLYVNGRPLTLRSRRIAACSEEEATSLHQKGYNSFITPVTADSLAVWEQADQFGFLVLGQLGEDADETRLVEMLRPHASCLGWLSAKCRALSAEEAVAWYLVHGNPGST